MGHVGRGDDEGAPVLEDLGQGRGQRPDRPVRRDAHDDGHDLRLGQDLLDERHLDFERMLLGVGLGDVGEARGLGQGRAASASTAATPSGVSNPPSV